MHPELLEELTRILQHKERLTYDLRRGCEVDHGISAAYALDDGADHYTDLSKAIEHALSHDGMLTAWQDRNSHVILFNSCRLFDSQENAIRFAREQKQTTVHNIQRGFEIYIGLHGRDL